MTTCRSAWRLLDYLGVDYSGAVPNGKVVSASEYAEMREFSGSVRQRIARLPANSRQARAARQADELVAAIERKASPQDVAGDRRDARLGPAQGLSGRAGAAASAGPRPRRRAVQRRLARAATATRATRRPPMARAPRSAADRLRRPLPRRPAQPVRALPGHRPGASKARRWRASRTCRRRTDGTSPIYVSRFAYPRVAARSRASASGTATLRFAQRGSRSGGAERPHREGLAAQIGADRAAAVLAYLRANPAAVARLGLAPRACSRSGSSESLAAYQRGDRDEAKSLALVRLSRRVRAGRRRALRPRRAPCSAGSKRRWASCAAAIAQGRKRRPGAVADRRRSTATVRRRPKRRSRPTRASDRVDLRRRAHDPASRRARSAADRRRRCSPSCARATAPTWCGRVHYGWVERAGRRSRAPGGPRPTLISISGATRELTEGVRLDARRAGPAVRRHLDARQRPGRTNGSATSAARWTTRCRKGSAWFLFCLAFIAVYRELFETILFYAALSAEGSAAAVVAGAATGAVAAGDHRLR